MLLFFLPTALAFPGAPAGLLAPEGSMADRAFFSSMFDLEPMELAREDAATWGARDGTFDAEDPIEDGPMSVVMKGSRNNPENPTHTAGLTFFGQFVDHDLAFARDGEDLDEDEVAERTQNFRTAAFDMDSAYGSGPVGSPELYEIGAAGYIYMRVETIPGSGAFSADTEDRFDLPREQDGTAIIGDRRNDENVILSQFHVAMLRFHNAVTDFVIGQKKHGSPQQVFTEAQKLVRWHYQWIILHEFLPLIIGQKRLDDILKKPLQWFTVDSDRESRFFRDGQVQIPSEFAAAAYRFGHSMINPAYELNFGPEPNKPESSVFRFLFDTENVDPADPDPKDLRGGVRAPRRFVDWQAFFDFEDGRVRRNKKIDIFLSTPLFKLPEAVAEDEHSLCARNLIRGRNFGLPSGQAVAKLIGAKCLSRRQLRKLETPTPLFLYILQEAACQQKGERLGDVGSAIVGEVFVGLLRVDPDSYLSVQPDWTPNVDEFKCEPRDVSKGEFTMTDLLCFAGVVPSLDTHHSLLKSEKEGPKSMISKVMA